MRQKIEKMSHENEKMRKMSQHKAKSAEARPAQNSSPALPPFELPPLLALGELTSTSSAAARAFRHPPRPLASGRVDGSTNQQSPHPPILGRGFGLSLDEGVVGI